MVLTLQLGYIETLYWKNRGGDGHLHLCEHTLVLVCRGQRRIVQPDNILLAISIHQFYLPQEFPQIFIILVYIHPKAKASAATEHVKNTMSESVSPDAPRFHIGDLNHCSLDEKLKGFDQYIGCSTWFGKTLDKCYGSNPKCIQSSSKGSANHNSILLAPAYLPVVKRSDKFTWNIQHWTPDSIDRLQGCFEQTDWNCLLSSSNIDEQVDTATAYISFCVDSIMPTKTVTIFPNNKPWVTKELKQVLNKKKWFFFFSLAQRRKRRRSIGRLSAPLK